MPKLSREQWTQVRYLWEHEGLTQTELSLRFNVGTQSIAARKKKENWGRKEAEPAAAPAAIDESQLHSVASAAADATIQAAEERWAQEREQYEAVIAGLEKELVDSQQEAAGYKEWPHFETADDMLAALHDKDGKLTAIGTAVHDHALAALGTINKERMSRGQPFLDFNEHPDLLQAEVEKHVAELVRRRTAFRSGRIRQRTIKMVSPNGNMVQAPVELQINNEAAQPGAAIWKLREKGFKVAFPYRCQRANCWELAAVDSRDRLLLDGYDSHECRSLDPYIGGGRVVAGLTTSDGKIIDDGTKTLRAMAGQVRM